MNVEDIRFAFERALDRADLRPTTVAVPQEPLKRVAVMMADELVGAMKSPTSPTLWSNRVPDVTSEGWLRHARATACAESMVDVLVCVGETDPYETLLTMECEASEKYEVHENSTSANCDYLWDLYKLLHVPSPLRVFIARHAEVRHPVLASRVQHLVSAYSSLYRAGDRIFSVLVPTACFDQYALPIRGWHWSGGRLESLQ